MTTFDTETAQHGTATAAFAARLATAMALEPATVENCRLGALLHDVGMLIMDRRLLHCPSMLADAEWDLMQAHPQYGEDLLFDIPSLAHIAPIVRSHHERMDGTGYPDALLGYEIPIEARIIAVADAFHTMTMPRPYRDSFSTTSAIAELVGNSGTQFDETVVAALSATQSDTLYEPHGEDSFLRTASGMHEGRGISDIVNALGFPYLQRYEQPARHLCYWNCGCRALNANGLCVGNGWEVATCANHTTVLASNPPVGCSPEAI